jgi:hypothetical protein
MTIRTKFSKSLMQTLLSVSGWVFPKLFNEIEQYSFHCLTDREMEESGRPRLPWTQEFAGSNPAFPTKLPFRLTGRTSLFDSVNRSSNP